MATPPDPREWIAAYARVQQVADSDILAALRRALKDIEKTLKALQGKTGIGAVVRREQLIIVRASLLDSLGELYTKVGDVIRAQQVQAARAAINLQYHVNLPLFQAAGTPELANLIREGVTRGLERTLQVMVTRMTQSRFDLSERIYRSELWTQNQVEKLINSALARGLSPAEFAKEARKLFDPSVPGGTRFASMRLARSEINNAYHAMSVNAADAPWVTGMQWHLSRSHPKADDCDTLATQDLYEMGAGVYPVLEVPRKPHPQCFCVVTPVVVEEDAFLDALVAGKYDRYINRTAYGSA